MHDIRHRLRGLAAPLLLAGLSTIALAGCGSSRDASSSAAGQAAQVATSGSS
jgi:hypothetical protein